jgi:PPOX class probable F420-dependent enzyme
MADSLATVLAYLQAPRCAVLSSLGLDGTPHQAVLHYRVHEGGLLVNGRPDRRWAMNLRRDARVSVVVHDADEPLHWVGIRGVAELLAEGPDAVRDAMETARQYGEDPAEYAHQQRISFVVRPHRVLEYDAR